MSFTDTARHWLWGCPLATAASRSDVKVAIPHLRGRWSPTKATLRILEALFMKTKFLAAWRLGAVLIKLVLQVASPRGNGVDPSDFAAPGSNKAAKAAFRSTAVP